MGTENDLRFTGYAALFDVVDRGGDVVRRGAFAASLARARGMLPLLWEHDVSRPIGLVTAVEDVRGLRVDGRVSVRTAAGREAARMLGEGAVRGLSFGYRVREARGERPRALLGVDVVEVSVVRAPMQLGARVERVTHHPARSSRVAIE